MREIMFGCQIHSTKEWIYWNALGLIMSVDGLNSLYEYEDRYYGSISKICGLIDSKTICQYTGSKDKKGNKIFEGDVCEVGNSIQLIVFDRGRWIYKRIGGDKFSQPIFNVHCNEFCEITGNIHDSKEKLGRKLNEKESI